MSLFTIFNDDSYTRFITPLHREEKLYGINNQHIDNARYFYQKPLGISAVFIVGYGRIRTAFRLEFPFARTRSGASLSKSLTSSSSSSSRSSSQAIPGRASPGHPSAASLPLVSVARRPCNQSHKKYTKGSGNVSVPRVS